MQNKKLTFTIIILAFIAFSSCRKRDKEVSTLKTVSFPIIYAFDTSYQSPNTVVYYQGIDLVDLVAPGANPYAAQIYCYSYPVGQGPALSVRAYDSATGAVPVDTIFNGHYDPNKVGLYIYQFNAKSSNGYGTLVEFVIAVTNYNGGSIAVDSGYTGIRGTDTIAASTYDPLNPPPFQIYQVANGLYLNTSSTVEEYPNSKPPLAGVALFFMQTDSTHIIIPNQPTNYNVQQDDYVHLGIIGGNNGTVSYPNGLPVIQYTLVSDTLNLSGQTVTFTGI